MSTITKKVPELEKQTLLNSFPNPSPPKQIKLESPIKRKKQDEQFEDISEETVTKIISMIDDPNYMSGPDVSKH